MARLFTTLRVGRWFVNAKTQACVTFYLLIKPPLHEHMSKTTYEAQRRYFVARQFTSNTNSKCLARVTCANQRAKDECVVVLFYIRCIKRFDITVANLNRLSGEILSHFRAELHQSK